VPTHADLVRTGAIRDRHRVFVLARRPSTSAVAPAASTVAAMIERLATRTGLRVSVHAAIATAMHGHYHPWLLDRQLRCPCCPSQAGKLDGRGWLSAAVIPPELLDQLGRAGLAYDDVIPAGRRLQGADSDRTSAVFFGVCDAHAWLPSRYERALAALLGRGDRESIVLTQLLRRIGGSEVPELGRSEVKS
jgi:hypothetical protein